MSYGMALSAPSRALVLYRVKIAFSSNRRVLSVLYATRLTSSVGVGFVVMTVTLQLGSSWLPNFLGDGYRLTHNPGMITSKM